MIKSNLELVECVFPENFPLADDPAVDFFCGGKKDFLLLKSYKSLGHGPKTLCAALSFLEQQFYFSLSALVSAPLLLEREESSGLCYIERKNDVDDKVNFFCEEHILVSNLLLGLDLLTKQYENDFFVRVDKCRRKKVKVHQTTTGIAIQSI